MYWFFVELRKIRYGMLLDLKKGIIHNAQRIIAKKMFNFNEIHQVRRQWTFHGKLCFFKDIILVAGEEFTQQWIKTFYKSREKS